MAEGTGRPLLPHSAQMQNYSYTTAPQPPREQQRSKAINNFAFVIFPYLES